MEDLRARWPLAGADGLRDRLLAAYDAPARGYHDLTHLAEVLAHVDLLAEEADNLRAVVLAAWFHDAVYDGGADDEEQSAEWAEAELPEAGVPPGTVAAVGRLVRLTSTHRPAPDDRDGQVLSDADLAILAADAGRYAAYVAGVRAEYAAVPDADFRRGRAAVLRDLLAKPAVFHTGRGRRLWEEPARANVERELAALERG